MKNKRKSKTLSIKDLSSEFYGSYKIKKGINEIEILNTWNEITNNQIQKRTKKLFLKEKILFIKISSSPLRNELTNNKKTILSKIKKRHNSIDEIYFI